MTVWLQRFVVHYTRRLFTILPELGNVGFGHRRKSWSKTTLQRDLLNHWILAICPFFDMQKSVRSTQQFVCWLFNFLMEFLRFERFWTHFLKRLFGRQSWFIFLGFFLACISDLTQLKAKIFKLYLKKNKKNVSRAAFSKNFYSFALNSRNFDRFPNTGIHVNT